MIRRIGVVGKVNVSVVRTEPDPTKYGLQSTDINKNKTFEKLRNVSDTDAVKNGFQSKTDKTDIRNMYQGNQEANSTFCL